MPSKFQGLELGKLKVASQPHSSRKSVFLWYTPDNDDTEFNCVVSSDSLVIVIEEKKDYFRVITENNNIGWIHISNTEDVDE